MIPSKFRRVSLRLSASVALWMAASLHAAEPRQVSGIYPHLAMFNNEGECGTGAVVPWADRLWVITYAPHMPLGSSDKFYEITPGLEQIIRPESVGGTPANRMIHKESGQLFIGAYVVDKDRNVRTITPAQMYGRHTGLARHLEDPAGKLLYATMEEGFYEVDVKELGVKELWADEQRKEGRKANLPGYHGKGFYSGQGRYVYANNGDHAKEALVNPAVPSGVLAEWDGKAEKWSVVRRNQFCDVTGPGGIFGEDKPGSPIWSIGWDHRSLILMLLDQGKWSAYRLPKASHCYDGAHGWNTEWPRIREIGEESLLMTMHGEFWKFPATFCAGNSAGITPRSTYLKVVGDFARWKDRVVLGCDDAAKSEFLNKDNLKGALAGPGQSQSNLWFVAPERLDDFGPSLGRGAVWMSEDIKADVPSEPFLFAGFEKRSLHLAHRNAEPVTFTLEVDARGNGQWTKLREVIVPAKGSAWTEFAFKEAGAWVRVRADKDCANATAFFHYRGADPRGTAPAALFAGLARPGDADAIDGTLLARGGGLKTLRFLAGSAGAEIGCYELDGELRLKKDPAADASSQMTKMAAIPRAVISSDAASVVHVDASGKRWRLPKAAELGDGRVCREVCTERNLLNVAGTFYELPAENAGGFIKIRPVSTHGLPIADYASFRGMLVLSGVAKDAPVGDHIVRSEDGQCALWVGAVDDLWKLGKPRGEGGPWKQSALKAGVPSDPYLATGYDRKRLTLIHDSKAPVGFIVQADFTANGEWTDVCRLSVPAGQPLGYQFPDAFGAYWLRIIPEADNTATATFTYE